MRHVLAIGLVATGCLASAGPATFRAPAASFSTKLAATAPASVARAALPAESLDGAWRLDGDRVLLDLRGESTPSGLNVHATCGPLVLWDAAARQALWRAARPAQCADRIVSVGAHIIVLGQRERAGKPSLELSAIELATGDVTASVPVAKGAVALAAGDDVILVDGAPGRWMASVRTGATLAARWQVALDDPGEITRIAELGGSVLVFGHRATAIDRTNGARLHSTALGRDAAVLDLVAGPDVIYAYTLVENARLHLSRVAPDGTVAWTNDVHGVVDSATTKHVFLTGGPKVIAISAADGKVAWTADLPGRVSGLGLISGQLLLVPTESGVVGLELASGDVRFTAAPFGSRKDARAERLSAAGDGLVVLDTAAGLAGIEPDHDGHVRWAIAVRSLPYVQRQARVAATKHKIDVEAQLDRASRITARPGVAPGGGMVGGTVGVAVGVADAMDAQAAIGFAELGIALNARREQHANVAFAQASLDEHSPVVLRPISWSTGRGVLAVRKTDGAFRELVIGPPDVYEDLFRASSIAVLAGNTVLTVAEGLDTTTWVDAPERPPVQLVARNLLAYALDDADFKPATDYARTSIVPAGSFELP